MKKIAVFVLVILFVVGLSFSAYGEEIFDEEFFKEIENMPDKETKEVLDEFKITPESAISGKTLSTENIFSVIKDAFSGGYKKPLSILLSGIAQIILLSAFLSFFGENSEIKTAVSTAFRLSVLSTVIIPVFSLIKSAVAVIKGLVAFYSAFIPVFSGIIYLSGKPAAAASFSASLFLSLTVVNFIGSFLTLPLLSACLALTVVSGFYSGAGKLKTAGALKTAGICSLSVLGFLFSLILSIKGTALSAADNLSARTVRFLFGGFIPVLGSSISSALSEIIASVGAVKSSVFAYGEAVIIISSLPLICEIIFYLSAVFLLKTAADIFASPDISDILKEILNVLTLILGICLFSSLLFLIEFKTAVGF